MSTNVNLDELHQNYLRAYNIVYVSNDPGPKNEALRWIENFLETDVSWSVIMHFIAQNSDKSFVFFCVTNYAVKTRREIHFCNNEKVNAIKKFLEDALLSYLYTERIIEQLCISLAHICVIHYDTVPLLDVLKTLEGGASKYVANLVSQNPSLFNASTGQYLLTSQKDTCVGYDIFLIFMIRIHQALRDKRRIDDNITPIITLWRPITNSVLSVLNTILVGYSQCEKTLSHLMHAVRSWYLERILTLDQVIQSPFVDLALQMMENFKTKSSKIYQQSCYFLECILSRDTQHASEQPINIVLDKCISFLSSSSRLVEKIIKDDDSDLIGKFSSWVTTIFEFHMPYLFSNPNNFEKAKVILEIMKAFIHYPDFMIYESIIFCWNELEHNLEHFPDSHRNAIYIFLQPYVLDNISIMFQRVRIPEEFLETSDSENLVDMDQDFEIFRSNCSDHLESMLLVYDLKEMLPQFLNALESPNYTVLQREAAAFILKSVISHFVASVDNESLKKIILTSLNSLSNMPLIVAKTTLEIIERLSSWPLITSDTYLFYSLMTLVLNLAENRNISENACTTLKVLLFHNPSIIYNYFDNFLRLFAKYADRSLNFSKETRRTLCIILSFSIKNHPARIMAVLNAIAQTLRECLEFAIIPGGKSDAISFAAFFSKHFFRDLQLSCDPQFFSSILPRINEIVTLLVNIMERFGSCYEISDTCCQSLIGIFKFMRQNFPHVIECTTKVIECFRTYKFSIYVYACGIIIEVYQHDPLLQEPLLRVFESITDYSIHEIDLKPKLTSSQDIIDDMYRTGTRSLQAFPLQVLQSSQLELLLKKSSDYFALDCRDTLETIYRFYYVLFHQLFADLTRSDKFSNDRVVANSAVNKISTLYVSSGLQTVDAIIVECMSRKPLDACETLGKLLFILIEFQSQTALTWIRETAIKRSAVHNQSALKIFLDLLSSVSDECSCSFACRKLALSVVNF